jgi:SAM-dependent MidA family methyltransferase
MLAASPYADAVSVADAVARAIRDRGPIGFDRYMELALYGEDGYYDRPPVGPRGDFVTSPHVHRVFAELLGRAIEELDRLLGSPRPLRVAEVGAGDGTLARELLPHLERLDPRYTAVERSRGARDALAMIDGVAVAEDLAGEPHVVLANELLDNLPFRRFRGTAEGAKEIAIDLDGDRLVERLADAQDAPRLDVDAETVVPVGALAFVDEVAARLARPGYALLIDYGGAGEPGGPPHGYREHRVVEDLLAEPGSTDITAGVDFERIAEHAVDVGLVAFPSVTQRHALIALGFDRWIRDALTRQGRLLDERDGLAAVRAWSGRSSATLLVDPTALGRLRWLLLATPGLPAASWL